MGSNMRFGVLLFSLLTIIKYLRTDTGGCSVNCATSVFRSISIYTHQIKLTFLSICYVEYAPYKMI